MEMHTRPSAYTAGCGGCVVCVGVCVRCAYAYWAPSVSQMCVLPFPRRSCSVHTIGMPHFRRKTARRGRVWVVLGKSEASVEEPALAATVGRQHGMARSRICMRVQNMALYLCHQSHHITCYGVKCAPARPSHSPCAVLRALAAAATACVAHAQGLTRGYRAAR